MSIINYIILLAVFCITPAGVIWLCRRYSLLGKLGPIICFRESQVYNDIELDPNPFEMIDQLRDCCCKAENPQRVFGLLHVMKQRLVVLLVEWSVAYDKGVFSEEKRRSEEDVTRFYQDIFNEGNGNLVFPNSTSADEDTNTSSNTQEDGELLRI